MHATGSRGTALICVALVAVASACAEPSSSATVSPSAGAGLPLGSAVPANMLGDWFLPPAIVVAVEGSSACRLLKLTLTATTYRLTHDPACGALASSGEVVVNKSEIDFFNADVCGLKLPDGVGRYTWTLSEEILHFVPLNQDPCPRGIAWLANRSYSRSNDA